MNTNDKEWDDSTHEKEMLIRGKDTAVIFKVIPLKDYERAEQCVNALSGISEPEAYIASLLSKIEDLEFRSFTQNAWQAYWEKRTLDGKEIVFLQKMANGWCGVYQSSAGAGVAYWGKDGTILYCQEGREFDTRLVPKKK